MFRYKILAVRIYEFLDFTGILFIACNIILKGL
jgi:hypothetical protein